MNKEFGRPVRRQFFLNRTPVMATFSERLSETEKINATVGQLLSRRYSDERRLTLLLAYLNLCLDHHRGIVVLMVNKLYGPAMALVRVTFEAMIKAHWVAKCASDAQVDDIAEHDNAKFPKMYEMAEAVDKAFSDPNVGIPMMSISHSDLMPIRAERSDAGPFQFETVIGIRQ